jgi:hypothetical protein
MTAHPVQLHVVRTERVTRIQVAVRIVLVVALAIVSWPALYWILYLTLPAIVALILLQKGVDTFRTRDAPRLILALRWLAGAEAYLYFLTNELPTSGRGAVDLQVNLTAAPTAGSALMRLLSSLPALLLVALLSAVSSLVWIVAAIFALAMERIPRPFGDLFLFVLRLKYRLAAYHLSLVERYPSLAEEGQGAGLDHALST